MSEQHKTKAQLTAELAELRLRLAAVERAAGEQAWPNEAQRALQQRNADESEPGKGSLFVVWLPLIPTATSLSTLASADT